MNQVAMANTIGFISALITLGGASGVTTADVNGFFNVCAGLVTLGCFVWSHRAHKKSV